MRYSIGLVFALLFLSACSQKEFHVLEVEPKFVQGLDDVSQNVEDYLKEYKEQKTLYPTQEKYDETFYRIWKQTPQDTLSNVQWPQRVFTSKYRYYGSNLKPLDETFYIQIRENMNFSAFKSIMKKALTLRATSIRAFPTDAPLFKNPTAAGEGFPFDYLQNSLIAPQKPLVVSHLSKDGAWAFVWSSFTSGWIRIRDVAFIDDYDASVWMRARQVRIIKEGESVADKSGFLYRLRLGMLLPLVAEDATTYTLLSVRKNKNNAASFTTITIPKKYASESVLTFSKEHIATVLRQLRRSKYGWGGLYEERDCSATIRDYFAPFGIWLGRNSSLQARSGTVIDVRELTIEEKREAIVKNAVPFETLLYRKGHIALYVGTDSKGRIVIFQNLWGIKTKYKQKSGRYVIGRSVFSTLTPGENLTYFDDASSFLETLESFNTPTR